MVLSKWGYVDLNGVRVRDYRADILFMVGVPVHLLSTKV